MSRSDPHRSDEVLFLAYQRQRDCNALGVLFRRRVDELLRLAVFLAARPGDAEDLVQATFLSAISRAETFRPDGRVMAWLCGILTNHARMLRRAEQRRPPDARSELTVDADPMLTALRAELRTTLDNGIANLPEPYRAVLQLYLREGLDSREISQRLSRPRATVRKQMERAIDRLRIALPMGLATAVVMRLSPAQIADNAAEAARFVDPIEPLPAAPPAPAPPPTAGLATLAFAAIALVTALTFFFGGDAAAALLPTSPPATTPIANRAAVANTVAAPTSQSGPTAAVDRDRGDAAQPAQLNVVAIDREGRPRVGVELLLVRSSGKTLPERLTGAGTTAARTDANGIAVFAEQPVGPYELMLPGALPRSRLLLQAGANTARLVLPAPNRFSGTVIDAAGYPIADAEILVTETACRADTGAVVAITDRDGNFATACAHVRGRVFARHADYARSSTMRLDPGADVKLTLQPSRRRVAVTVVDAAGAPMPDCYVALAPRSPQRETILTQHGRTDAAGRCTFLDPGSDDASVVASFGDLAPSIEALPAAATELTVRLTAGGCVHGVAVDASGRPLGDRIVAAAVTTRHSNDPAAALVTRQVRTAADGSYRFTALPSGSIEVRMRGADASRSLHAFLNQFILAGGEVELAAGETRELQLTARPFDELGGSLCTPDGQPLDGWHVVAVPRNGIAFLRIGRSRAARTSPDGTFRVPGVSRGSEYDLGVFDPGANLAGRDEFPLATGRAVVGGADARLVVEPNANPGAMLTCRVLAPNGQAAAREVVELKRVDFWFPNTRTTALDGSCSFGPLAAGEYMLAVAAKSSGTRSLVVRIPADGRDVDLGAVRLESPTRLCVHLNGRGAGLGGMRVVARTLLGDKFVGGRTDWRGQVRLKALPPGSGRVLVHGPGIAPQELALELEAGRQDIDVGVRPAPTVALRFPFDPVENPFLIDGPLWIEIRDGNDALVFRDGVAAAREPGLFCFDTGLLPGRYRVRATSLWNATADLEFTVARRGDNEVTARLGL